MSTVQCSALNNALRAQGISYAQLSQRVNSTEQRVADICTGKTRPTTKEFNDLAVTLGISNPPSDAAHATR